MKLKDLVRTLKDKDLVISIVEKDTIMANHTCWIGTFPSDKIGRTFSRYDTAEVDTWWIAEDNGDNVPYIKVLIK